MQIFEFHFNPKVKEDEILDSFIYEPENVYEKKLGNLYIAGELTNVLPQNRKFLNNLAAAVKKSYYMLSAQSSPEKSMKKCLKEANHFLEEQEKEGNISWMGNLNLAVISLKENYLNFAKVGKIKIILSRGNQITDIGKQLRVQEADSPLKIFSNIVSGKLAPEDKLIVLTNDVYNLFAKEEILPEIISVFEQDLEPSKTDRELKKILNKRREMLAETSGLFLLMALETVQRETIQVKKPITLKKKFSLKLPGIPAIPIPKIKNSKSLLGKILNIPIILIRIIKKIIKKIKIFKIINKLLRITKGKVPLLGKVAKVKNVLPSPQNNLKSIIKKPKLPKVSILTKLPSLPSIKVSNLKQIFTLVILLIIVISIGSYIFKVKEQKEIEAIQAVFTEIQQKMEEAENALIFNDEKRANVIYQEAWEKVIPLTEEGALLRDDALALRDSIEKELFPLNKMERINDPQVIFEFDPEIFSPQKIILSGSDLYFTNPQLDKIYKLEINQESGELIQASNGIQLGMNFGDFTIFFSEPNQLISLEGTELISTKTFDVPYSDFKLNDLSRFGSNIYSLDSREKEIIRYEFKGGDAILLGEPWLDTQAKKPSNGKSMAIDGSIWILNEDKTIFRYYKAEFEEELTLDFFPSPEGASKIYTSPSLSYLYLLTPDQNRIVILDKTAQVVKQYQSDHFNKLKDFSISEDGKIIYLLNDLKIYKIEF